jgi:AcrR family transcriptional regulator
MAITGRPRKFVRDEALEAAMLVFWRNGYTGTSMHDLCDAMGIRSPSLYATFGGKEDLYLEAIEHHIATRGPPVWGHLSTGETARAGLENLLLAAAAMLPACGAKPAGCMTSLAAIGDEWPPTIVAAVKKIRATMLGMLHSRLEAAVASGELPASSDIDGLSRLYLGTYQGMAIQARDGAGAADLQAMANAALGAWPSHNHMA